MDKERKIQREGLASPDRAPFLMVDPDELMRDNPAALIVNREIYDGMKLCFAEERFITFPPEVARVRIHTSSGEEDRLFVVDGLTRTKFASDHKGQVLKSTPNMRFDRIRVMDITSALLKDPRYVQADEYQEGQESLTELQYLRAVVLPTLVHAEIADDRFAAHIINLWRGMVGPDLAEKFPALQALSFLANERIPIAPTKELQKALNRQERLVVDEQPEERKRLNKALCNMAAIIIQSKRQAADIEKAAYFLVGTGSPVIGGKEETKKQIFGLLRTYAFQKKLDKEYRSPQLAEAEHIRHEFSAALEDTFNRLSDGTRDGERSLEYVKRALDDDSLTISQTLKVMTSPSPAQEYYKVIRDINKQTLKDQYLATVKRRDLTDVEQALIDNLGNQTYLLGSKIPLMVREIQYCAAVLRQSQDWQQQLKKELDDSVKRGVSESTISEAISQMSQRQEALMSADSSDTLAKRAKQLQEVITDFKNKIAEEILKHDIAEAVTKVFGQELKTNQDPNFKNRIVWAAIREERDNKDFDPSNPRELLRWVNDLKGLDPELQTEVISGDINRMASALRLQVQRRMKSNIPQPEPVEDRTPPVVEAPFRPEPDEFQPQISPGEIRQKRVELSIKRLVEEVIKPHIIPSIRFFATFNLDPQDIPLDLKEILGEAENAFEKFRGGHPDAVRVMDETYPELLKEVAKLRGVILEFQRHQASKDTFSVPNS